MLEAALAAGVAAGGGHALLGGVLPTPGAALLVRRYGFDLAAVVSASHNPYRDNGIKFFGPEGTKLSDEQEARDRGARGTSAGRRAAHRPRARAARRRRRLPARARAALRRASTCPAGGSCSTAPTAPPTASRPRSSAAWAPTWTRSPPSPTGATSTTAAARRTSSALAERVAEGGYDVGFAFDGDGDRVLAVDRDGAVVDGDELIALAALHLREHGRLPGDGVAVTVMTNYGFHQAMEEAGIEVATTPVGDRHVLAELLQRGWALGGEQSGPHHRHRLRALRRRHRRGAAHARGARRSATSPSATRCRSCPSGWSTCSVRRPRRDRSGAAASGTRSSAESQRARGPRPGARPPVGHRAAGARDGRGAARRVRRVAAGGSSSADWPEISVRARPAARLGSTLDVRNHRIRRAARVPRPAARRPAAARVPRLRLGRPLARHQRRRSSSVHAVGNLRAAAATRRGGDATATCAAPPASATRAGPPTAG